MGKWSSELYPLCSTVPYLPQCLDVNEVFITPLGCIATSKDNDGSIKQ